MVLEFITETSFLRGVFWALVGVGFWVGGVVVAHYLWERSRDE